MLDFFKDKYKFKIIKAGQVKKNHRILFEKYILNKKKELEHLISCHVSSKTRFRMSLVRAAETRRILKIIQDIEKIMDIMNKTQLHKKCPISAADNERKQVIMLKALNLVKKEVWEATIPVNRIMGPEIIFARNVNSYNYMAMYSGYVITKSGFLDKKKARPRTMTEGMLDFLLNIPYTSGGWCNTTDLKSVHERNASSDKRIRIFQRSAEIMNPLLWVKITPESYQSHINLERVDFQDLNNSFGAKGKGISRKLMSD
jgi:hypothetical protein